MIAALAVARRACDALLAGGRTREGVSARAFEPIPAQDAGRLAREPPGREDRIRDAPQSDEGTIPDRPGRGATSAHRHLRNDDGPRGRLGPSRQSGGGRPPN